MVSGTEKLAKSPLGYILFPQQEEPPSLESSTDDVLVAHIQSVVDASGGTMGLVDLNERLVPGTYSREKDDVHLTALKYTGRPLGQFWRRTSFSGMTRDAHADDAPVKDVDAVVTEDDTFVLGVAPVVDTRRVRLAELPGGAHTGNCLHQIYEDHDFSCPEHLGIRGEDPIGCVSV